MLKRIIFISIFCFIYSKEISKLEKKSLLYQSKKIAENYSGKKTQWKNRYGFSDPKKACETASVWFTAYPPSVICSKNQTIFSTLGDEKLWKAFYEIGIDGIHTGPFKIAGSYKDAKTRTPSIDGGFDWIGYKIDPQFGTEKDYFSLVKTAKKYHSVIIGDIIPGHTGIAADFLLALKNYKNYPGIYHIIEIEDNDWDLLPDVEEGKLTQNLSYETVMKLKKKGYIAGPLERVIFYAKNIKETNWSATKPVLGTDKKERRWVYLHYFKEGQPSLNWLDPSFGAERIVFGDVAHSHNHFENQILRLDANGFLGIEKGKKKTAFSESHPLTLTGTDLLGMMIRKIGGYSFQELNQSLSDIYKMSKSGADLSYDFITRTAYIHAILQKDTHFLRLKTKLMQEYHIEPLQLIHALQNHDEFTYELIHFEKNKNQTFSYKDKPITGKALRDKIRKTDFQTAVEKTDYNYLSGNGICTTTAGLLCAALNVKDPFNMTGSEKQKVQSAHLALVFYNAMQPGVFALSGWDLVGALPLKEEKISSFLADKDYRWINRGGYDLLGQSRQKETVFKIPKAESLYGSLPKQLKDSNSFASKLKTILHIRKRYQLHLAQFHSIIDAKNPEIFIAFYQIPDIGLMMSAVNFSDKKLTETITLPELKEKIAVNVMKNQSEPKPFESDTLKISLDEFEGKAVLFRSM